MVRCFDDVPTKDVQVGLLVDANGRLAVVAPRRSAATVLGVAAGDTVIVRRSGPVAKPRPDRSAGER